jgi:hypothetical protein
MLKAQWSKWESEYIKRLTLDSTARAALYGVSKEGARAAPSETCGVGDEVKTIVCRQCAFAPSVPRRRHLAPIKRTPTICGPVCIVISVVFAKKGQIPSEGNVWQALSGFRVQDWADD